MEAALLISLFQAGRQTALPGGSLTKKPPISAFTQEPDGRKGRLPQKQHRQCSHVFIALSTSGLQKQTGNLQLRDRAGFPMKNLCGAGSQAGPMQIFSRFCGLSLQWKWMYLPQYWGEASYGGSGMIVKTADSKPVWTWTLPLTGYTPHGKPLMALSPTFPFCKMRIEQYLLHKVVLSIK